jgi:hypothetical protein
MAHLENSNASFLKKKRPWISPLLLHCKGQTFRSYSIDVGTVGPGSYTAHLKNSIGSNPKSGFLFTKTRSDREDSSMNRKYVLHGGQVCLAIDGANVHTYTSAVVDSLGSDGLPWRGKGQFNKFPSMPRAVFGLSPRFRDSIRSFGILDGRRPTQLTVLSSISS